MRVRVPILLLMHHGSLSNMIQKLYIFDSLLKMKSHYRHCLKYNSTVYTV